jgi:hypothetical protein
MLAPVMSLRRVSCNERYVHRARDPRWTHHHVVCSCEEFVAVRAFDLLRVSAAPSTLIQPANEATHLL